MNEFSPFYSELILSASIDPILYLTSNLYRVNPNVLRVENQSQQENILKFNNIVESGITDVYYSNLTTNDGYLQSNFNLSPDLSTFVGDKLLQELANYNDYLTGRKFKYRAFSSLELLSEKEASNSSVGLTANIKPFYNYYSKKYEQYLNNITSSTAIFATGYEYSLPNFYSINNCLIDQATPADITNVGLGGSLDLNILKNNIKDYFEIYASSENPISFYTDSSNYKTIILPDSSDMFFSNLKLEKEDIPFGVEISFDSFEQNEFADFLINDGYFCTIAKNLNFISNFGTSENLNYYQSKTIFDIIENVNTDGEVERSLNIKKEFITSSLSSYDYTSTISGSEYSVLPFNTSSATIEIYDNTDQYSVQFVDCTQPSDLSSILDFYLNKAKIETELNKLKITYLDIPRVLVGAPPRPSEKKAKPIMFAVEKYKNNVLLQTYYVPNSGRNNLIDSQVNIGETYTYKIFSISLVPELEYYYSDLLFNGGSSTIFKSLDITIGQTPSLKLVKNEVFTKTVVVFDNPPLAPDVTFYPVLDSNNIGAIQLLLNSQIGNVIQVPILFNESLESVLLSRSLSSQEVQFGEKLLYSTDDPPYAFLVHKKKIPPKSYSDFVNSTTVLVLANESYSKLISDKLDVNTKYYFCFRVLDIHRQISNPSVVYEVEIVEDKGNYYPSVRPYVFPTELIEYNSITFKKYLYITPSLIQTVVDEPASGLVEATTAFDKNIVLGPSGNRVWDKKFKLRLTSKTSGKIVDINVTFDQEHIVTEDEKNRVIT